MPGSAAVPAVGPDTLVSMAPVVRAETLWLLRRISHAGWHEFAWIRFRQRVLWLRQADAQALVARGGACVEEGRRIVDSAGFLTCIAGSGDAVAAARELASRPALCADPELAVVVSVAVVDFPVLEDSNPAVVHWNGGADPRKIYRRLPSDWYYADLPLFADLAAAFAAGQPETPLVAHLRPLQAQAALAPEVIWSSRLEPAAAAATVAAFREQAIAATLPLIQTAAMTHAGVPSGGASSDPPPSAG